MALRLPMNMDSIKQLYANNGGSSQSFQIVCVMALLCLCVVTWARLASNLGDIPTIGSGGRILSYTSAFRWLADSKAMVQEGYDKYKGTAFKVANLNRWLVIVSGPTLVEELRQAGDDELSSLEATVDHLAIDYTLGPNVYTDPYHIPILRNQLTKSLAVIFSAVRDEIVQAFDDAIPPTSEWTKISATEAIMQIVCQTSNRLFVGVPLCRDPEWQSLNIDFTVDVAKAAIVINLFPDFLKPLAGRFLTNVHAKLKRGIEHMAPIIQDRRRFLEEYGKDWEDKPIDILSWLMDERPDGAESSIQNLTLRVMTVNFAAIHTSSMSFTHALYHLAAMPYYILPMREEVEAIVKKEGWTKGAVGKMRKVDSFLKESQRFTGLGSISMVRKALKDFTFSNGTTIPKGTFVCAASRPIHRDEEHYPNPDAFDGFRFADMRLSEAESVKHQLVATNLEYLTFGHGRHACPGRFFAANEMKAMMAHLVLTYDVKLETEGVRPPDLWFGTHCIPNQKAEVLFRKRQN